MTNHSTSAPFNAEKGATVTPAQGYQSFGLRHSFVIPHSDFVINFIQLSI